MGRGKEKKGKDERGKLKWKFYLSNKYIFYRRKYLKNVKLNNTSNIKL